MVRKLFSYTRVVKMMFLQQFNKIIIITKRPIFCPVWMLSSSVVGVIDVSAFLFLSIFGGIAVGTSQSDLEGVTGSLCILGMSVGGSSQSDIEVIRGFPCFFCPLSVCGSVLQLVFLE